MTNKYDKTYKLRLLEKGWTTRLRPNEKETTWGEFYRDVVKKRLRGDEIILDIGTAEGRRFSQLASKICFGIGIDKNANFIRLAINNQKFIIMDSKKLLFAGEQFDIVTCRHAPINLKEIYRILKSGDLFITQQVAGDGDKINLKRLFKRGQDYRKPKNALLKRYKRQMRVLGFKRIKYKISNITHYFKSRKNLIEFLYKTPTIPNFNLHKEKLLVDEFILKFKTPLGIKSNSKRFLLEGFKPANKKLSG